MSEWLIHCMDDLQSGAFYASVDNKDGEQPILILFKKDGEKTIVVGQGEPLQDHGRLGDLDALAGQFTPDDMYYPTEEDRREYDNYPISMRDVRGNIEMAPTIIQASEEVYASGYDTADNYHWTGTRTGEHIIPTENEEM